MSKHTGFGAIADSAHKLGEGVAGAAHTAQDGTMSAIHGAQSLVRTIQHLGLDDVLGVVGLQRRRSSFGLGSFLGGVALGAGVAIIAAFALPQVPRARRAVRHFVRGAVASTRGAPPKPTEVMDRNYQNGKTHTQASA